MRPFTLTIPKPLVPIGARPVLAIVMQQLAAAGYEHITLAINGVTTVDYTEADKDIPETGFIALQVHSGPPLRVEFRNIRIKQLKK